MAKLSTGQTYGTTSRVTSPRLLGGEEQIASGNPLAQAELGQPALQPQASPVNTFQQVGAPTLGGPLRMFEPPALPRPSQDLANLAEALSGFNTNLQQYATSMKEVELAKDQAAKEEGQAVGAQLQQGGYTSIKQAIAEIGKKVETDPSLRPLYNTLQANNPARDRYINDTLSNLAIQSNLISLPSKLASLKALPISGRLLDDVDSNDPEFRQLVSEFIYGSGTTPKALANNSVAVAQSSAAAGVAQQQRFVDAGNKKTIDTHWQGVSELFYNFAQQRISQTEFSQKLAVLENNLYNATSPENFKKYKEGALANFGNLLLVHQENARDKSKFMDSVLVALGNTGSGPVKDNKQVESLLGSFGVPAATARFQLQKVMKQGLNAKRIEEDQAAERTTQDLMNTMLRERFTPDVVNDPAKYKAAETKLKRDMLLVFPDARQLGTAQGMANSVLGQFQVAYISPKQQQNLASEYEAAFTDDIPRGKTRIRNMFAKNEISQESYNELNSVYTQRQSGQNKLNIEDVVSLSKQLEAKQKAAFGTTYFGDLKAGALGTGEQQTINQDRSRLKRKAMEIINNNPGKDVSAEIQKLYATEMVKYDKAPVGPQSQAAPAGSTTSPNAPGSATNPAANRPEVVQSPEGYMKLLEKEGFGNGWFGVVKQNTPQKVTALNREIKNTKLYNKNTLIQQLDNLQAGKELDEPTKLIIKSSTMKPSEFFLNQLRNHGLTIMPGQEQMLKDLDKSNLVSKADTAPTMAYPGFAVAPQATAVQDLIRQGIAKFNSSNLGTTSTAVATPTSNSNAGRKLRVAIIGKESGGNYEIVNPDFGAIGIGQVLPENVPSWTAKHYGQRLTPSQYRYNRAAQDAVVHGQLQDYYDAEIKAGRSEAIAVRRAASAWYSGDPNKYDNNKVQTSGGKRYPSIREYTMDILRRYQRGN